MLGKTMSIWMLLSITVVLNVLSAGVATHLTYLARIMPTKFQDYHPWLKAGAFFPDSLYSCKPGKKLHDFAESTHWPEFLISALKLWRERYANTSERYSPDSLKLQAFLTGIFSHQIVDSSWHSLVDGYRSHGLLRVLAETEFDGDIDEAHNYIDVMGEFLVLSNVFSGVRDSSWQYYTDSNWSLPREEDMMALLSRSGLGNDEISFEELKVCVMRGLSASLSEVYVTLNRRVEILNLAYGISPVAKDFIQDSWLGGEFDLIAMLQKCLPIYQDLFESDTNVEQQVHRLQLCGNLPEVSPMELRSNHNFDVTHDNELIVITSKVPRSNFGTAIAVGRFGEDNELFAAVSSPLEESQGVVYLISLDKLAAANVALMKPFTRMAGQAMRTYTFNGSDFLVVSEPGSNSIHFHKADKKLLTVRDASRPDALQLQLSCVADVDGDAIPDLILSGASYGPKETGFAMLVRGSSLKDYLISDLPTEVDISALSTIELNGGPFSKPYQHFGAALAISHKFNPDGFLYVTCQSLGIVFAYSLAGLRSSSLPRYVITESRSIHFEKYNSDEAKIIPSSIHGMFGKNLLSWSHAGTKYIAATQHLFNRVFIYHELDGSPQFFLKVELQRDNSVPAATIGFGSAIQYDEILKSLFISSPGTNGGQGAIWKISMEELVNAARTWRQSTFYVNFVNHLYFTNPQSDGKGVPNFGKTIQVTPDQRLIIGVPQLNYGNLQGDQLTGSIIIK